MDHTLGIQIFEEIQARPYRIATSPEQVADNCYFKGIELLQRLGILGYTVRGRVGETYWDPQIAPAKIIELLPNEILVTHFFVEVLIDNEWRIIDPSFQKDLASYGFTIGSWDNGEHCFPITKLYTQEESIAYQQEWFNSESQKSFFLDGGECWKALDAWFQKISK